MSATLSSMSKEAIVDYMDAVSNSAVSDVKSKGNSTKVVKHSEELLPDEDPVSDVTDCDVDSETERIAYGGRCGRLPRRETKFYETDSRRKRSASRRFKKARRGRDSSSLSFSSEDDGLGSGDENVDDRRKGREMRKRRRYGCDSDSDSDATVRRRRRRREFSSESEDDGVASRRERGRERKRDSRETGDEGGKKRCHKRRHAP
eukprot:TRINITY_DN2044_c0_g1_i2.p1 TRINITY_DN2044_c0_g1~~TRINITY_DN2044_c0_g1_i2.p1  ORF type:complete len:204 (+),score=33.49 TRINITY_DN2044_c0_g1_i2:225-836(+)